jgi:hypothetical protein
MKITRYCHIRNHQINLNNQVIYKQPGKNLDHFLESAYDFLKPEYPKFYKMDRLSKAGMLAAEVLLSDGILKKHTSAAINLVLSNAASSLDTDLRYAETTKTMASPALFVYTLPNIVAGELCIRHKIRGENAFFVSEKFDPLVMAEYVTMVLSQKSFDVNGADYAPTSGSTCLAGWVEVFQEHHDVFLYLVEKESTVGFEHSANQLNELYNL